MPEKQLQLGEDDDYLALQEAWKHALEILSAQINKPSFESWIRTAKPIGIIDDVVRIATTSLFGRNWLESKHSGMIADILRDHLHRNIRVKFEYVEGEEEEAPILTNTLPKKPIASPKASEEPISQPLNPGYNFDSFVVGPTNRLAHACAIAISEDPGRMYNPLFLYGGPGLGKTHLMHAIGHQVMECRPGMQVVYVSGEAFTYQYITSLREHKSAEFRRRYRNVDIWLVDDVQFLMGKDRTEEEFFHTFNALHDIGKQIVLTSDRAPKDLELDARLLSRFQLGMLADISPPDLETRMAILQTKANSENMTLSDEVILYIARLITRDIRELQGALIKLHAYASLMRTTVTTSLAEDILGQYFGKDAPTVIDVAKVQQEVAKRFNVEVRDITGRCRSKDIVAPRQVAMYLTRELTDFSLPAIGKAFGGKDHTTVMHACKKVEEKMAEDKSFSSLVEDISRSIK